MPIRRFCMALLLLCAAGVAQAGSGTQALKAFYKKVHTLSAHFQQVERDDNGNVVQQASGTFLLSRPNDFRWEYAHPYKQIMVSNGSVFKFYDVDLQQVTIRPVGKALKATPALLLTGGEALDKAFKISDDGSRDGLDWVRLTPRKKDTDFKSVELGLKHDIPQRMKLHDNLGQTTNIAFGDVQINPSIPASRFKLQIPDNVEVVRGGPGASQSGAPQGTQ